MDWHSGRPRLKLTGHCSAEEVERVFSTSMVDVAGVVEANPEAVYIAADDDGWPNAQADYEWLCSVVRETLAQNGIIGVALTFVPGAGWRAKYRAARGQATDRQARLAMAACCRLLTPRFFDARIPAAVDAAERCADDPVAEEIANAIGEAVVCLAPIPVPGTEAGRHVARAIDGVSGLLHEFEFDDRVRHENDRHALAHAAYLALRQLPREVFTGGQGDAVEYCAWAVERAGRADPSDISARIAGVVRDIFGDPARPDALDPRWRSADVVGLARGIYEDRAFDRLPILADALMDAGCADEDILTHCRDAGPHVRGCWVVDLVLGQRVAAEPDGAPDTGRGLG